MSYQRNKENWKCTLNILKCFKTVGRGGSGQELDPGVLVVHHRAGKGKDTLYGEGVGGGVGQGHFVW